MSRWAADDDDVNLTLDGAPVALLTLSSALPTAEDLGAAPAALVDVVARKADLDPATGKVRADQLPATSGGTGATSKLLIVQGSTDLVVEGFIDRILFASGTTMIGSGATFGSPPIVAAEPLTAAAGTTGRFTKVSLVDATGFTLDFRRTTDTPTVVTWFAIGVSA